MARTVDVTIKGKNEAGPAFRKAGGDVSDFEKRVTRAISPLRLFKGILAGLGIASFGAILRKATQAYNDHERSLGRNVEKLDRLSAAWDFVLVRLGSAIMGMDQTGSFTDRATVALSGLGEWIDENKGLFETFANTILMLARHLGSLIESLSRLRNLDFSRSWLGSNPDFGGSLGGGTGSTGSGSFATFLAEREKAKAREAAEIAAKEAARAMQRDRDQQDKAFGRLGNDTRWYNDAYLKGQVGTTGFDPKLSPIGDPKALEVGTLKIGEMQMAMEQLGETIKEVGSVTISGFADVWSEATQAIVTGSDKAGRAIGKAIRRGVGQGLIASGQSWLLEAGAIAAKGLFNPVDWWRAGRLAFYGTSAIALGATFAGGGGGGGGGGLSAGSLSQQQQEMADGRGAGTIVIQGGLLDMNDPRQADALADALEELSGRRVTVQRG